MREPARSVAGVDPLHRRRVRRLTEAVYDGAARDRGDPPPRRQVRVLPGPGTVAVLAVVLLLIAGVSVWRSATSPGAGSAASGVVDQGDPVPSDVAATRDTVQSEQPGRAAGDAEVPVPQASVGTVVVYVTGRVAAPGVVELPAGSRVLDAVTAAGGPLEDADLEAVNLARVLVDGEHVVLVRPGEAPPEGQQVDPSAGAAQGSLGSGGAGPCVDLQTADAAALETLDGIGPALAGRIVAYRDQAGSIGSVEQLDEVAGIGPALVERISAGACP